MMQTSKSPITFMDDEDDNKDDDEDDEEQANKMAMPESDVREAEMIVEKRV